MHVKVIKTYSRKRKRSASTSSDEQPDALPATAEKTSTAVDAGASRVAKSDAVATSALPSPPASSSPQHQPLQSLSPNTVAKPLALAHLRTDLEHEHYVESKATEAHQGKPQRSTKRKPQKLTQLTLDLGGAKGKQARCTVCGMTYVPCNAEDAKLHREFHAASLSGVAIPAGVSERWRVVRRCARKIGSDIGKIASGAKKAFKKKRDGEGPGLIVEVGVRDALSVRNLAKRVLDVAEQEMGAVGVAAELWHSTGAGKADVRTKEANEAAASNVGQEQQKHTAAHKVYLHVQDATCIGLCLAERITSAFRVEPDNSSAHDSSSISASTHAVQAALGISRIWVSREFRSRGIAKGLLDVARREFLYGIEVRREDVAFSQPTASGGKLARAWFGRDDGWLVYGASH